MRSALPLALLCTLAVGASGCGGSGKKAAQQPRWVQRANAICKRDGRKITGIFDSAAMVTGLEREARDLARAGFFEHVPAAAVEVQAGGRLQFRKDESGLLPADRHFRRARRDAARVGVHCSFAAVPLPQA